MKTIVKIIWTLFVLIGTSMYAQNSIKIEGVIKDVSGETLQSANVIAFNTSSSKMESYGISNHAGEYKLSLKSGFTYRIRTSFIGFEADTFVLEVNDKSTDIIRNTILKELDGALDEVILAVDIPIVVKGDSIVYHADDFQNGTEEKLGDILKKLPGVEVNDDGEIEVEGKVVQKVMVEGKDFFDGDSKLAVENIPSDAVEKIEVLKNFSEVSQLQNVTNNQDNIAMNIKLKEGKKNFWFGDITAGVGLDERYLVHPKLFYYSPKKSINIITDFNNIGEIPFTRRDYFNFTGGFRNMHSSTGTSLNLTSDNLGFSLLQNNRAKEINTKFAAANLDYEIKKGLDLSGFFIYSGTENTLKENKSRAFIKDGVEEFSETQTVQNNDLGLGKLSLIYKPNSKLQVNYDVFGKLSKQTENTHLTSRFNTVDNTIDEIKEDNPFSIQQNASLYFTRENEDIISAQFEHLYSKENPFYQAGFLNVDNPNTDLPFNSLFPFTLDQTDYELNQDKMVSTNKVDVKLDYYHMLNKKSNFNVFGGQLYSKQDYDSDIFQSLDDGSINSFSNSTFVNRVDYTFSDTYLGGSYRLLLGDFTINPSLAVHNYYQEDVQNNTTQSQSQIFVSPKLFIDYKIKKSESLRFTYNKTAQFSDIYSFAQGYVLNSYSSLYGGNNAIENGVYDNYQLSYNSFSFYNGTNVNANLSYSKKNNPVKNSLIFDGINAVSTTINSTVADESINAFGRVDKSFGKFKLRVNSRVTFGNNHNVVNDQITQSKSITQRHQASIQTTFKKGPNFEIGYQHIVNDADNNNTSSVFTTQRPFVNVETIFLKYFTFKLDYSYYNYADERNSLNTYQFMNTDLTYKKEESKWEYKLGVTNLLNTKSLNSNTFTDNYSSSNEYTVQPRYLYLTLKYTL